MTVTPGADPSILEWTLTGDGDTSTTVNDEKQQPMKDAEGDKVMPDAPSVSKA
jgi:hypothetical protein